MRRCFIAIPVPEPVQDALEPILDSLRTGSLTAPDRYHVTLSFLGDQPDAVLDVLHEELERITSPVFSLQPRGLGTFGGRSPRVLWAGLVANPALVDLHRKVRSAVRAAGIDLARERFRPHITLARFPERLEPGGLDRIKGFLERFETYAAPPFEVADFTLFESLRTRDGPIYEPLADYGWDMSLTAGLEPFSRSTTPAR